MTSILFIGGGNMSSAIFGGLLESGAYTTNDIFVIDPSKDQQQKLTNDFGLVNCYSSITDAIAASVFNKVRCIVLGTKPAIVPIVLKAIAKQLDPKNHILVSIAAGITTNTIFTTINQTNPTLTTFPIVRVMPNTPALVKAGISGIAKNDFATDKNLLDVCNIMKTVGDVIVVDEHMINSVTAVSGSGPAYVIAFVEALTDGAVKAGMTYTVAYQFALATLFGTAKLLKETGTPAATLRQNVTSPGGTTIYALTALKENGFDHSIIEAVMAAKNRGAEMAKL